MTPRRVIFCNIIIDNDYHLYMMSQIIKKLFALTQGFANCYS